MRSFIYDTDKNRSVLQVIFGKVANVPIPALSVAKDLTQQEIEEFCTSDATELEGATKLDAVSTSLKNLQKFNLIINVLLMNVRFASISPQKKMGRTIWKSITLFLGNLQMTSIIR